MALELGFKLARQRGLNRLTDDDFATVHVAGDLQVRDGTRWRNARASRLRLLPADASFALKLLRALRGFLAEVRFNYHQVDFRVAGVFWDLLGDFTSETYGVLGQVGVEVKAFTEDRNFEQKVADTCAELEAKLQGVEGVLLLAARCKKQGREWAKPQLFAKLYNAGLGQRRDLGAASGRPARRRGFSPKQPKLTKHKVFQAMTWHGSLPGVRGQAGLLKHFLAALGLEGTNADKRAAVFNKRLEKAGHAGRLVQVRLPGGERPAWVGSRTVLASVFAFV